MGSAVVIAAREAIRLLMELAVAEPASLLYGAEPSKLQFQAGQIRSANGKKISPQELLGSCGRKTLEAEGEWTPALMPDRPWSGFSFGAHFCEVAAK